MLSRILPFVVLTSSCFAFEIPLYSRVSNPTCTCECNDRIIFKTANINENNLKTWASEAATMTLDYGFGNYQAQLQKASQYFTRSGWDQFIVVLEESKNVDILLEKKLVASTKLTGPAQIIKAFTLANRQHWVITVPLEVTYTNHQNQIKKSLTVKLQVLKTDAKDNIQNLAIESYQLQVT